MSVRKMYRSSLPGRGMVLVRWCEEWHGDDRLVLAVLIPMEVDLVLSEDDEVVGVLLGSSLDFAGEANVVWSRVPYPESARERDGNATGGMSEELSTHFEEAR